MSRLIAVSNRVADFSSGSESGGLAVALGAALRETKGLWFGWNGKIVADGAEPGLDACRQGQVDVQTTALTKTEHAHYYEGFSNQVLWPICHYRLDLAQFDGAALAGYRAVNARFARMLADVVQPDDLIWVHDYHLIPLAGELRELGLRNRIGFFLHIPFPPPEMISAVPEHEWLVDTFFAYDVVGFQTDLDVENFARYVEAIPPKGTGERRPFRRQLRPFVVQSFPIGIDVSGFADMAATPKAEDRIARLRRGRVRNHVIGVDRLDYSKGLPDRFRAFDRFLDLYPDHRKTTVLMQVAPPTRESVAAYTEIREELEQLSGSINGRWGDFDWTPIRYIHRSIPRETLAAVFRGSNVGLVTPLRDGMNLVAKEYVAAQDPNDPGVLVLSKFAGAAADLREALIVNPYDQEEVAHALNAAIAMRPEERRERHHALLGRIERRDIDHWRRAFLDCLSENRKAAA